MKTRDVPKAALSILMLIFSIIMIFPFILTISTSLKSMNEIYSGKITLLPQSIHFENYFLAVTAGNWPLYIWNSVIVSSFAIIISLIINSMAGYTFARLEFKGRDLLFYLAIAGIMIPPQVTMIPVFLILKHFPLAGENNIWGEGGIGLINTLTGLIAPHIAGSFGVFLCRQFFLSFPKSLDDAANIDGSSAFRTYIMIYLPLSKPILATLAILKAVYSWNEYTWPLILTNSEKIRTVQLALTMYMTEERIMWNQLMAMTVIISLPLIIVFVFAQKYFVQGIVTTGMKG